METENRIKKGTPAPNTPVFFGGRFVKSWCFFPPWYIKSNKLKLPRHLQTEGDMPENFENQKSFQRSKSGNPAGGIVFCSNATFQKRGENQKGWTAAFCLHFISFIKDLVYFFLDVFFGSVLLTYHPPSSFKLVNFVKGCHPKLKNGWFQKQKTPFFKRWSLQESDTQK